MVPRFQARTAIGHILYFSLSGSFAKPTLYQLLTEEKRSCWPIENAGNLYFCPTLATRRTGKMDSKFRRAQGTATAVGPYGDMATVIHHPLIAGL